MHPLAQLDQRYVWHPFTQMRDWLRQEPIVIVDGRGAVLRDVKSKEYLDANSSIWTNLHGHQHPRINAAIRRQLGRIAHSSALGLANEPASLLAKQLVRVANPRGIGETKLEKVFFSDDGSTALEVALKLAYEFTKRTRGRKREPRFLSLAGAYHGDTVGAVSLGHSDLFHKAYSGLLFKTDKIPAPYCYRCPFNRAKPQRADARMYRNCRHECVSLAARAFRAQARRGNSYAAFVFEPLMQGAAGMIAQPEDWLRDVSAIARDHGTLLIADEVMTGFGRTGFGAPLSSSTRSPQPSNQTPAQVSLFASHHEDVQPDFLCVAKGLTGGYLPMAATLTTRGVFDAFLGEYEEFKTFFHGHSFTANQLGAAASLASLGLLNGAASLGARQILQATLRNELENLWQIPQVGDIRQAGLVAGIELVRDWRTREPFALKERAGIRVCEAMARRGVLTRPVGNVLVLMPPYCTTPRQVRKITTAIHDACAEVFR
ncbi:MAG TPA: aminotransferase class III-fold pyridoxal phosphate-dependent enzyme [Verrucomicrobiae bacterium]|nr:aminotransferase class III-fold pyridoxal phosphate-dependent enzyme [Verrucomicrobiae bacterium]